MPQEKVFDKLLLKGIRSGKIPAQTAAAREWFRDQARNTKTKDTEVMKSGAERLRNRPRIGDMYFFYYDPKHKATLPYYDRFPMIFPIEKYKDGFLGINLHYLPYKERAMLMDALYSIASDNRYDETTQLNISYNILKAAAKFKHFRPCVKRYLSKHLRSRMLRVYASEWDIALFLPVHDFQKANARKVWADSRKAWRRTSKKQSKRKKKK